ncbi:MAG: argininosuccinate lyase [Candidatus Sumerlaeia bacterium]
MEKARIMGKTEKNREQSGTSPEAEPRPAAVWQQATGATPSELNVRYCAGRDVYGTPPADERLLPFDLWLNRAHAVMLLERGIVPRDAGRKILLALDELESLHSRGRFSLDPALEDVHTNIEAFIAGRFGEGVSGYLHTARSRNDQVATAMRMFLRDWTLAFVLDLAGFEDAVLERAAEHLDALMPGFTHYQPATATTFAHWLASYIVAFLRDMRRLEFVLELFDECPLGAAASFGTSWPIDRARTAELLAFSVVHCNSLDCVRSRGEMETQLAAALAQTMKHFSIVAQDLVFLGAVLRIVRLDASFTTGSSMMPQKRNPDFAEVTRAKSAAVYGALQGLLGINTGQLSGYNRDMQWTKYLIMDVLDEVRLAPLVFRGVIGTLEFDRARGRRALRQGFLEAADLANYLAQNQGLPFRTAYRVIGRAVQRSLKAGRLSRAAVNRALREEGLEGRLSAQEWKQLDSPEFLVAHKTHIGGPAPTAVEAELISLRELLKRKRLAFERHQRRLDAARARLNKIVRQILAG